MDSAWEVCLMCMCMRLCAMWLCGYVAIRVVADDGYGRSEVRVYMRECECECECKCKRECKRGEYSIPSQCHKHCLNVNIQFSAYHTYHRLDYYIYILYVEQIKK